MVTITQSEMKPQEPARVPAQKYYDIRKRIDELKTPVEKPVSEPVVVIPSPGVRVEHTPSGEFITRVAVPYGAASTIGWTPGEPVTEVHDGMEVTTTPYTLTGTITGPRKTEGITPIPQVETPVKKTAGSISQGVADFLGLSRMQSQELFLHVDVPGDPSYREKLLSAGIADVKPSERDIIQHVATAPSYVGLGASFKGIAGALAATSKTGLRMFQVGTGVVGGVMVGHAGYDIATEPSPGMREWKAVQLGSMFGLMAYGAKPTYFGYKYPSTHLKTPSWVSRLRTKATGQREYGGFVREPTVRAVITDKTPPTLRALPDPKTGKILDVSGKASAGVRKPVVEPALTGQKGWTGVKEIAKTPRVDIGKGGDMIPPPTETGYQTAMRYIVSDYGKPSKFTGFKRLESGTLLESGEAYASLFPQIVRRTPVPSIARTSPGKTLYWRAEMISALNKPFAGFMPVSIPLTYSFVSDLTVQEQELKLDTVLRDASVQVSRDMTAQQTRQTSMVGQMTATVQLQRQEQQLLQELNQTFTSVARTMPRPPRMMTVVSPFLFPLYDKKGFSVGGFSRDFDDIFDVRRERKHRVGDPFKAMEGFKL